jgi:hypothetical protein
MPGELPGHRDPSELTSVTAESLTSGTEATLSTDIGAIPVGLTWQQFESLARDEERSVRVIEAEIRTLLAQLTAHEEQARRFRSASQRAMPPKPES